MLISTNTPFQGVYSSTSYHQLGNQINYKKRKREAINKDEGQRNLDSEAITRLLKKFKNNE